jgi:hypothetical protein
LFKSTATIRSFNPRAERNGPKNVPAGDLSFAVSLPAAVVDDFIQGARAMLFARAADAPPPRDELQLADPEAAGLTALRNPNLKPLVLDEDFPGYTLSIVRGNGMRKPIEIEKVELSKFAFEAKQGGTVNVTFSASFHPDEKISGPLCQLIQEQVEITLVPPRADGKPVPVVDPDQQPLELTAPDGAQDDAGARDPLADAAAAAIAADGPAALPALRHAVIERVEYAYDAGEHLYTTVVAFTDGSEPVKLSKYAWKPDLDEIIDDLSQHHDIDAEASEEVLAQYAVDDAAENDSEDAVPVEAGGEDE